jgi:hypothetical protein
MLWTMASAKGATQIDHLSWPTATWLRNAQAAEVEPNEREVAISEFGFFSYRGVN